MKRVEKQWPKLADTRLLGKRTTRIDGPDKVRGKAKYTFDINRPGMLYAKYKLCPHGHAVVKGVDVSAALELPGVVTAYATVQDGFEVPYAGLEVAVVAAETEEAAREAVSLIEVEYEVADHLVVDREPEVDEQWQRAGRERAQGDVDEAFADAAAVVEGRYGCSIITHCCLESHGVVIEFQGEDAVTAWVSSQAVSGIGEAVASQTGVEQSQAHVICEHLGGGFGSKFGFDGGREACDIAQKTGRPVKLMLERDQEIAIAGSRPSAYADVKVGVSKAGDVVAFEARSWGTDGHRGRSRISLPYVFDGIPNQRTIHNNLATNTGPARAWRAPSHPQQALITMAALEDAAAALGMDPLQLFRQNLALTARAEVYAEELDIAAELMDWQHKWRPRASRTGEIRSGVGLSIHTWGGRGHDSNCQTTLHSDGSVEVACGTQDLGVGTRTVLAVVTAETLGLPVSAVGVRIGDNRLPPSGPSGGSTTVGGISSASRVAAVNALNQLLEKVAPELRAKPAELVARDGKIFVADDPSRALSYQDACALIGPQPIVAMGQTDGDLMNSGVGGVQMAEVEVDTATGVVRMKKLVAVQDCGTIIDLMTAESQVYGACIMGITAALFEERVMDPVTGTVLNPDMEFYRLAGIGDIGEIVVHMMQSDHHHSRGVIGLGEPPAISPMAAISNAVANAIGVRVPMCPLTPREVLTALNQGAVR